MASPRSSPLVAGRKLSHWAAPLLLLAAVALAAAAVPSEPEHVRLIRDLMANYEHSSRPVLNRSDSTLVQVDSKLFSILKVNEAEESITYAHWYYLYWTDMLLTWNPDDYGGVELITFHKDQVWIPDILTYEVMSAELPQADEYMFVRVRSNGAAVYATSEIRSAHCHFDVSDFPYDRQNCTNTYVSWTHGGGEIVLKPYPNPDRTGQFQHHSEWELVSIEASSVILEYAIGDEIKMFYEVPIHITIQRRPLYYIISLVVPIYAIAQVTLVGIFTPFDAAHTRQTKIDLGLNGMLCMSVMLLVVSGFTPRSATDYPLLGVFMLQELLIIGAATFFSTVILHLHSRAVLGEKPPKWLLLVTCQKMMQNSSGHIGYAHKCAVKENNEPVPMKATGRSKDIYRELLGRVDSIYQLLCSVRKGTNDREAEDAICMLWTRVCMRLDAYCLVVFFVTNTVFILMFLL